MQKQISNQTPNNINNLPQQNQSIKSSSKPNYKLFMEKKFFQLQNKTTFFEGQLDPLLIENRQIRDKLNQLNRQVSISTEMLRNLLVQPTDPVRKLELKMSNMQGISKLISQDWKQMQFKINLLEEQNKENKNRIDELCGQFEKKQKDLNMTIQRLCSQYQYKIQTLVKENQCLGNQLRMQKQRLENENKSLNEFYADKMRELGEMEVRIKGLKQEMRVCMEKYERTILRLRMQIEGNQKQYQKNRQFLQKIYQQRSQQKQQQLKKCYQQLIKMREEENMRIFEQLQRDRKHLALLIQHKQQQILDLKHKQKQYLSRIKQVQHQNLQLNNQIKSLQKTLADQSTTLKHYQNQLNQIKTQQSHNQHQIQTYNQSIKSYQQQIQQMLKLKQQQQAQLSSWQYKNGELLKLSKELEQRLVSMQMSYTDKMKKQSCEYEEKQQQLQKLIKQLQNAIKTKQKQFDNLHSKYIREEIKNNSEFERKIQQLISKNDKRIKQIEDKNRNYLSELEEKYLKAVNEIKEQSKDKIKNALAQIGMKQETSKKLQQQIHRLTKEYEDRISNILSSHSIKQQQINKIWLQKQNKTKQQHLAVQSSFKKSLIDLQKNHTIKLEALEATILKLKNHNGMIKLQAKLKQTEEKMKYEIEQLKIRAAQEKEMIVKQMRQQYQLRYQKLSGQFDAQMGIKVSHYENMIKALQKQHQQNLEQLSTKHKQKILEIQSQYASQIEQISIRLQSNIIVLNERLINEENAHAHTKLTREQQIQRLFDQIKAIQQNQQLQENKIIDQQLTIESLSEQLRVIDEAMEQKMRKYREDLNFEIEIIKSESNKKIQKNLSACRQRVSKIEMERIKFSQQLYSDFQSLKQRNAQQYCSLNRKYVELEKMFEERPSRIEDMNKIKELIVIKNKMDEQVKQFKKKTQEANSIIKYLNMEFENYREVFDMFGPDRKQTVHEKGNQDYEATLANIFKYFSETGRQNFMRSHLLRKSTQASPNLKITNLANIKNRIKQHRRASTQIRGQILNKSKRSSKIKHQLSFMEESEGKESKISQKSISSKSHSKKINQQTGQIGNLRYLTKIQEEDKNEGSLARLIHDNEKNSVEIKLNNGYYKISQQIPVTKKVENLQNHRKYSLRNRLSSLDS